MQIDEYMRSKKLPTAMREKTKDYFRLKFSNGKLLKEDEILDNLSPLLRREIQQYTGRDICKKIPLLSNPSSKDFAQDISCVIEPMIVFANEIITREGTTGDDMFFIFSGVVEIYAAAFKFSSYLAIGDGCVSATSFVQIQPHYFLFVSRPALQNECITPIQMYSTSAMSLSCWAYDGRRPRRRRHSARSIACERTLYSRCCATTRRSRRK